MTQPGTHPETSRNQSIIIGIASVVLAALFFYGYHIGSKKQSQEDSVTAQGLKSRTEALRARLRNCRTIVDSTQATTEELKAEGAQLSSEYRKLQGNNERAYSAIDSLEKKYADCMEVQEVQKATWTEQDERNSKALGKLDAENKELNAYTKQLRTTKGMRYQLLHYNIIRLKDQHRKLMTSLGRSQEITGGGDNDYYEKLVKKWGPTMDKWLRSDSLLPFEQERINRTVAKVQAATFQYNKTLHTDIFLPQKDENGTLSVPTWLGRMGSSAVTKGTYVGQGSALVSSLTQVIQMMYSTALCAYKHGIMNFTFQDRFRRLPSSSYNAGLKRSLRELPIDSLAAYIETPLVTTCIDCKLQTSTREFRLLCPGVGAEYGTYAFWSMRSRLQFKSIFYDKAAETMKQLELKDAEVKPFLSVLWRPSKRWTSQCQRGMAPGPRKRFLAPGPGQVPRRLALWLQRSFPTDPVPTLVPNQPCSQNREQVLGAIQGRLLTNPGLTAVYFPAYSNSSDIAFFQSKIGVPVKTMEVEGGGESTATDVVDYIISSNGAEIISNRYSAKGEFIVEMFLLKNNIRPKGIHWF